MKVEWASGTIESANSFGKSCDRLEPFVSESRAAACCLRFGLATRWSFNGEMRTKRWSAIFCSIVKDRGSSRTAWYRYPVLSGISSFGREATLCLSRTILFPTGKYSAPSFKFFGMAGVWAHHHI